MNTNQTPRTYPALASALLGIGGLFLILGVVALRSDSHPVLSVASMVVAIAAMGGSILAGRSRTTSAD